jgi:hypothetical protein
VLLAFCAILLCFTGENAAEYITDHPQVNQQFTPYSNYAPFQHPQDLINSTDIMRYMLRVCTVAFFLVSAWGGAKDQQKTDDEIKQELIRESIAAYPGTCPCPYNVDRAGHRCGRRSAYSRPGGYAPLCYSADITKEMLEKYRREHGEKQ